MRRRDGFGPLLVGALLVIFYLGGQGALYSAYHVVVGVDVPGNAPAADGPIEGQEGTAPEEQGQP